jgi:L-amino acid N-acyltransferase YncA
MVRLAQPGDINEVVEIYNQAIDAKFQTAFTRRFRVEERVEWFRKHLGGSFPVYVYETGGSVAGWFSISPYREDRGALRYAVEISYFVHKDHLHKGIGSALLQVGLQACRDLGYKTVLAIILDRNTASIRLIEKFGFERWAFLPNIADYDGVECSHLYYGMKM